VAMVMRKTRFEVVKVPARLDHYSRGGVSLR
jgi:hypothetical protein